MCLWFQKGSSYDEVSKAVAASTVRGLLMFPHSGSRDHELEVGWGCKTWEPTPSDSHPLAGLCV